VFAVTVRRSIAADVYNNHSSRAPESDEIRLACRFRPPPFVVLVDRRNPRRRHRWRVTMQYICLIYTDENAEANATKEQEAEVYDAYNAFSKAVRDAGVMVSGEAFHPTGTAKTVQSPNGSAQVSGGPALQTPLQLGGFYILDTPDIDTAAKWAAQIPGAKHGKIEVRPLVDFSAS
jgi:hypothetical protein